jgi:putative salt-induced outer membrane protein
MRPPLLQTAAIASGVTLITLGASAPALAQDDPAGLSSQAPASSGATEVAKGGFQAVAAPPAEDKDSTSFKVTAGGFVSQGNSRTIAATAAADYFLRRGPSQFTLMLAFNYGRSAPGADEPSVTTVENYQGRVRYDHFFSGSLAGFLSTSARKDRFQGLDLRLNVDPGLAYYFIDEKGHRLWAELGYDLQYDLRTDEAVAAAALDMDDENDDDSELRHNIRVFAGYDNQLSETLKFNAGLEYLQNVTEAENVRLNADAGLTSQLNTSFSVAFTISVKFDNNPVPGVEKTDIISALNLVYTMTQ